jgi:hypothetical protein
MSPERAVRPDRRVHRWFREGADLADWPTASSRPEPLDPLEERSMRRLELAVAGSALLVVVLMSFSQPTDASALRTIGIVTVGGVLFISALVSVIR